MPQSAKKFPLCDFARYQNSQRGKFFASLISGSRFDKLSDRHKFSDRKKALLHTQLLAKTQGRGFLDAIETAEGLDRGVVLPGKSA